MFSLDKMKLGTVYIHVDPNIRIFVHNKVIKFNKSWYGQVGSPKHFMRISRLVLRLDFLIIARHNPVS